jgi:hypothetical protein
MNRIKKLGFFVIFLFLLIMGCSSTYLNQGLEYYSSGDNISAYNCFLEAAKNGNDEAMKNIGWMNLLGEVTDKPDTATAIEWLKLSARHNNSIAINKLIELGITPPYPDIYYNKQQKALEIARAISALGNARNQTMNNQQNTTPSAYTAPKAYVPQDKCKECYSDFECGFGNKCVKPEGDYYVHGCCVTPVDEFGIKKYDYDSHIGVKEVQGCSFDIDCPIGFKCVKQPGQLKGLCVKK